MLRKASLRKITIATCALLIVGILYFFPTKNTTHYKTTYNYSSSNKKSDIFLIDENNYVALTSIATNSTDTLKKAKEIIEALIIGSKKSEYIPNGFKPIIPKNTTINNIEFKDNLLKIDFSQDFLKIAENNEEKMIEAITYSLTTIKDIKKVMIFVDGQILNELPHSKKKLPNVLDRSFGINKVYDLKDYKNTTKTTVYYISKFNDSYYYVPITKINNDNRDKVEVIISELKSNPIYQTNLMSYLKASAELKDYEIKENSINLSFNENLFSDLKEKNIKEEVKYTISLSIKDNLDIDEVIFLVNDKEIDKCLKSC